MITGSLNHPPPFKQCDLPVAGHPAVQPQVPRVGKPVGNVVVQDPVAGAQQFRLQIMFPPQGVGVDGKADIMTLIKLVKNIERLTKAGHHRPESAHHRMQGLERQPDLILAGKVCRPAKQVDNHVAGPVDAEASLPGRRQIIEPAGDQHQCSGTEHVGKLQARAKRILAGEQAGNAERFRHHAAVLPDFPSLGDAAALDHRCPESRAPDTCIAKYRQ